MTEATKFTKPAFRLSDGTVEAPITAAGRRGVTSFFADTAQPYGPGRVCHGLSCHLARECDSRETDGRQPVYCLGYCDQSPAWLQADNRVIVGEHKSVPVSTSIRSLDAEAVVTARIRHGIYTDLGKARAAEVYATLAAWLGAPRSGDGPATAHSNAAAAAENSRHANAAALLDTVIRSGAQGRGGAGFLTGEKWRATSTAADPH